MQKTFINVGGDNDVKTTVTPLAEAAAKASDPRQLPDAASEFCRMVDLRRLFGITRGTAYVLEKQGRIKTLSLRQRGHVRGVKLVSVPSVRAYLNGLLEKQSTGTAAA